MSRKEMIKNMPEVTHKGVLGGFVPVYCSEDGTFIMARWWWAEYLMDFVDFMVRHANATPELRFTEVIDK